MSNCIMNLTVALVLVIMTILQFGVEAFPVPACSNYQGNGVGVVNLNLGNVLASCSVSYGR